MELKVENITKKYKRGSRDIYAVNNIEFTAEDGEFNVIVGSSGSGKSTFLNIIAGLTTPTSGSVTSDDLHITELSDDAKCNFRNKKIGYISQERSLLGNLTVYENVILPYMIGTEPDDNYFDHVEKHARELLEELGIEELKDEYPKNLSGGELRRASIARALINEPKLILADEPTGELDPENTKVISKVLRKEAQNGAIVILVTHDPSIIQSGDKVYQMETGRLSYIKELTETA